MASSLETEIRTERLLLRPLAMSDAPAIRELAGDERVSRYTARIPFPYPAGEAERFFAESRDRQARGESYDFAVALAEDPEALIGTIGLTRHEDGTLELGYWLGAPFWGRGLASEAAAAVAAFGRRWRPEATIAAHTFPQNVASQRVLEKAGFRRSGTGTCHAPARACGDVTDAPLFVFAPGECA